MIYVRFESPDRDHRGRHVGVFGLLNSLARQGRLTADQEQFRRVNNDWYDAALPDPGIIDPTVYDPLVNPGAVAWFKQTAEQFISRVDGYLAILTTVGVPCVCRQSIGPGRILYEDEYQVVAVDPARTVPLARPQGEASNSPAATAPGRG